MSRRILVVDDDVLIVESLCDILELHGWETFRAHDGGEAATLVEAHDIGVVVMDVRMPRVDGVEGLRRIKRVRPGTRVVLMTAYAAQDLLRRAEEAGALEILSKPVEPRRVIDLIEHAASSASPAPLLVIDDNVDYLHSLSEALRLRDIPTVEATTLEEALREMECKELRAILLDLKLDRIDPENVLLAIRKVDSSVLLILYSGHGPELSRTIAGEGGRLVDAAFTKPLDIERLVELVNAPAR